MMKKFIFILLLGAAAIFAQDSSQTFLALKPTGVEKFLQDHPDYDGRGTIVFIFDTGVDMGQPGLTTTSTGEVKVIDVQDFTGQGDLPYYEADIDDENGVYYFENEDHRLKVNGADKLSLKAVDDEYFIGCLAEKLWLNSSSGASDVNGNGTNEDKFNFVVFNTEKDNEKFWVVYFDTDNDGDLSDEKPLRNYRENFDSFQIPNEKGLPNFTFGLNIFPEENKITLHFDDGAHGTHCAGIATGNKINDGDLYGVAPGANLISLKLGNNNFAGGATVSESMKKCFLYADKISKEKEQPCIVNMSFGIGSEIEGHADMEKFLDDLVDNNPYLYISTSNGNEGPGISTTGLPAASDHIFSSGAALAKEIGNDLYGSVLDRDIILHFSSRGGEVGKPNAVSPGACISTVPNWAGGDRFWGTSMASPYTAGVMSLLLSAAKAEFPDIKIPSRFLYKVIEEAAVPFEDYDLVDQGGGYINAPNAWELLKKYIKSGEIKKYETYTVSTFAPNMPHSSAPNLYIRNASYLTGNETFPYQVRRDNFINKKRFYRAYHLKSDSDWLIPVQKNTYIKNNQPARLAMKFDKSKMTEPGMYNGKITAFRKKTSVPEFEVMATVVIPYEFNSDNNYRMEWKNKKLAPGMHERYFLNVPAGASSMRVRLGSEDGEYTLVWTHLHQPDGRKIGNLFLNSDDGENTSSRYYFNLEPGVYELDVLGYFTAKNISEYNLTVDFNGVGYIGDNIVCRKKNNIELINNFNKPKTYTLSGKITGYEKNYVIELNESDVYKIPFVLRKGESRTDFKISISGEDFNKTTDFAIQIFNEDGIAVAKTGLSYKNDVIGIGNSSDEDSVNYILELRPAFADAPSQMTIFVKQTTKFKKGNSITFNGDNNITHTFYPSLSEQFSIGFEKPEQFIPEGGKAAGAVYFKNRSGGDIEIQLPIYFNF